MTSVQSDKKYLDHLSKLIYWVKSTAKSYDFLAGDDALDNPQSQKSRDQRAAAIAKKRQRDSCDRQQPQIHPDVNQRLSQHHEKHAQGQIHAEIVSRNLHGFQQAEKQYQECDKDDAAADKTELFGCGGKYEIRLALRQKFQLGLQSPPHSPPQVLATAHGNNGLQNVIALALRISRWI